MKDHDDNSYAADDVKTNADYLWGGMVRLTGFIGGYVLTHKRLIGNCAILALVFCFFWWPTGSLFAALLMTLFLLLAGQP